MPSRTDFDPSDITDLLPNIALIDVERNPLRFRYRLYGTAIAALRGQDLTGFYFDDPALSDVVEPIRSGNYEVVESKQPHYVDANYPSYSGRYGHFYRLALPMSTNGVDVDMILTGFFRRNEDLSFAAC